MVIFEKGLSSAMNAKIVGSGTETVVLAHGFGADHTLWDKILPSLSKCCQVLVFDWTFSGAVKDESLYDIEKYSTYEAFASDLIGLLDEMNLKSSTFVGHSMSGMIGCIASVIRPDLFKRLFLVGASPSYLNMEGYDGGFRYSDIEELIASIENDFYNWSSVFPSLVIDAADPPSVEKFRHCLQSMRPEVAGALARVIFFSDYRALLDKITVPCIIVQTTNDIVVPNSVASYMQKNIKSKSIVVVLDTFGHFPHLTDHELFLDVLLGFCKVY